MKMEFGPVTVNSSTDTDVIRAPLTETHRLPVAVKEFGSDPYSLSYYMLSHLHLLGPSSHMTMLDMWIVRVPLLSTSHTLLLNGVYFPSKISSSFLPSTLVTFLSHSRHCANKFRLNRGY